MTISSGTVELKAHVTQKQKTQAVTGNLALADFSGQFGTNEVRSLGTTVDFDVGMTPQQVQIRKLAGKLTQGGNAAGSFDVSGTYDSGTTNADVQATAQLALAALLQAVPQPDMSVTSGTVELKAHITQKQKAQAVTGNLALADFTGQVREERAAELRRHDGLGRGHDAAADPSPQGHGQADARREGGRQLRSGRNIRPGRRRPPT